MLGAIRCTPTCSLEVEAGLMPLPLLSRRNSAIYSCRVLTIPSHPVSLQLQNNEYDRLQLQNSPAISNMRQELFLSGLSPNEDFPTLPISDRLHTHTFNSTYNLHIANKEDLTALHFGIAGICCTPNSPGCTPNLLGCTPNLPRCTSKLIERYNLINESALLS